MRGKLLVTDIATCEKRRESFRASLLLGPRGNTNNQKNCSSRVAVHTQVRKDFVFAGFHLLLTPLKNCGLDFACQRCLQLDARSNLGGIIASWVVSQSGSSVGLVYGFVFLGRVLSDAVVGISN